MRAASKSPAAASLDGDRKRRRDSDEDDDEDVQKYWSAISQKLWRSPSVATSCSTQAQLPPQQIATPQPPAKTGENAATKPGKWRPEQGRDISIPEARVFYPDPEEFEDPIKYIASIRALAEPCGICRIVPPYSWRPPCPLKESNFEFITRVQQLHKLQNRASKTTTPDASKPSFGFSQGPKMNLAEFKRFAEKFKYEYFGTNKPELAVVEKEYWRIVENASESVEVLYGADLDTREVGSGFPKPSSGRNETYGKSGWNLNNIARLTGSMLSFEASNVSGVVVPWLYLAMCFSSFCWHVEDHYFYSINYMHFGDQKVWYGVPRESAGEFENTMKTNLPGLFGDQPDLLQKLVTQFSPALLQEAKVKVFKTVQRPGDFIVTFPRAYHCGFSTGFNCAEAVNFAPLDWFLHGQSAVELYQKFRRKASVSHDKLLITAVTRCLGAREDAERAHPFWRQTSSDLDQLSILSKAFKARVQSEHSRQVWLGEGVEETGMDSEFDEDEEKECFYCHFDLHLSAICCDCCPGRFSCLEHIDLLCKCPRKQKKYLVRLRIQELYRLHTSLEKLRSDHKTSDSSGASASTMSHTKHHKERAATPSVGSAFVEAPGLRRCSSAKESPVVVVSDDEELPEEEEEPELQRMPEKKEAEMKKKEPEMKKKEPEMKKKPEVKPDLTVELLEAGTLPQAGWCSKDSIFPAGFKSRVRYYNYLNLSEQVYYTSEIVDCGLEVPYFKVTLGDYGPAHVYVDLSIDSCWRAVQRRINFEIQCKRKLGFFDVPAIVSPENIKGLEMFGLSNARIKQVVEALDYKHMCSKYWSSKNFPESELDVLKRFFDKGDRTELWTVHSVFNSKWGSQTWKQASQALADVLQKVLESAIHH